MMKRITLGLAMLAGLASTASTTAAYGQAALTQYGDYGFADQQQNARYAGLYLSIPLGSGFKTSAKDMKYGFRAGFRRDMQWNDFRFQQSSSFNADMMTLDFSGRGFERLALAGKSIVGKDAYGNIIYLDDGEGEKDPNKTAKTMLWVIGGVVVGGAILIAASGCTDGKKDDEPFALNCPLN